LLTYKFVPSAFLSVGGELDIFFYWPKNEVKDLEFKKLGKKERLGCGREEWGIEYLLGLCGVG